MPLSLQDRITSLDRTRDQAIFTGMKRGIEKESLRITPDGQLAQSPHPKALGSALTHPYITTDYSEALLEFITPAYGSIQQALAMLEDIHEYTYSNIGDEMLWVNSMPCILGDETSIPIAEYGRSNIGMMKHVYRVGLWHRYGRMMQTIAGIHYNISFPEIFWQHLQEIEQDSRNLQDYISAKYFGLIRNFQRFSWLALFLFGASPAVCGTFLRNKDHHLQLLHKNTWYKQYGTSLRMGDLGYQNNAQSDLMICYNALDSYIRTLTHAINTPDDVYSKIGVKVKDEYRQLNANILQIENEYYGSIRPKRNAHSGEKPTHALKRGGVEYIELRCVDLDPFVPAGIDLEQAQFLEVFATWCLLQESPLCDRDVYANNRENLLAVVNEGRKPGLVLNDSGTTRKAEDWALQILAEMKEVAGLMDSKTGAGYSTSLSSQVDKITGPGLTTSENIIEILKSRDISFFDFAMEKALETRDFYMTRNMDSKKMSHFQEVASNSLQEQQATEDSDQIGFDEFLQKYFNDELEEYIRQTG